jgi:hypothetical protein
MPERIFVQKTRALKGPQCAESASHPEAIAVKVNATEMGGDTWRWDWVGAGNGLLFQESQLRWLGRWFLRKGERSPLPGWQTILSPHLPALRLPLGMEGAIFALSGLLVSGREGHNGSAEPTP